MANILRWGPLEHDRGVFGGGVGGYARYNSQALRSFLAKNHDIEILPMSVPFFKNKALATLHLPFRLIFDVVLCFIKIMFGNYDMIHVTALYRKSILREYAVAMIARIKGIKVFYDIRAGNFKEFYIRANPLFQFMAKQLVRKSNFVSVQGRKHLAFLKSLSGRNIIWIPNCFLNEDLSKYEGLNCRDTSRPPHVYKVIFVGYLIPEKGVDVLIKSAYQVSKILPIELTLVGEVSDAIKPLLKEGMSWHNQDFKLVSTGRLGFSDVMEHLNQSDLFVFVSRFYGEGHPNALNEAMAMGLPVIGSKQGFIDDLVSEVNGAIVSDPTSVEELSQKMIELLADWPKLIEQGKNSRKIIENFFVDNKVLKVTDAVYRCSSQIDPEGLLERKYQMWKESLLKL